MHLFNFADLALYVLAVINYSREYHLYADPVSPSESLNVGVL